MDDKGGLTEEVVQITLLNATGPKASLFVPEESFEQLSRLQIKILEEPSLRCVDLVHDELQRIVNCIEIPELKRYNNLREKIIEVVNNLLREYKNPTKGMIKNLISVELAHINTNHPDFIGGGDALSEILEKRARLQVDNSTQSSSHIQPLQVDPAKQRPVKKEQEEKKGLLSFFSKKKRRRRKDSHVISTSPCHGKSAPKSVTKTGTFQERNR